MAKPTTEKNKKKTAVQRLQKLKGDLRKIAALAMTEGDDDLAIAVSDYAKKLPMGGQTDTPAAE